MLIEQVRLVYASMTVTMVTMVPTFPAIVLLIWTLGNADNIGILLLWAMAVTATNGYSILDARRRLSIGLVQAEAPSLAIKLLISMAFSGASWGALAFGILGHTTVVGNIIVISALAGVAGGAVALLSPVFMVFVAFVSPLVMLTAARLLMLNDPAYVAFGLISLMWMGTLMAQSYMGGLAVRGAIELRFENLELLGKTETAQKNAEQANTAKSKFLAAASHDLRQPIHSQGLFLEVLSRTDLSEHQSQVLSSARLASQAASDMLNTLLDFSRIEAGVVKPVAAPFDLQSLLDKVENDLAPLAISKGLTYRSRASSAVIDSDTLLVEMVLRNLISNAIRYTERGGVLVACRSSRGAAVVEVWDTGIGIAQENQADIFREFHQLGNPERDRRKGLGLGLAIADGLAKAMGHALTLQSRPGRGSVFRLVLPLSANVVTRVGAGPARQLSPGSLVGVRMLMIDDDPGVLEAMSYMLSSWGCEVTTADSVESAVLLARLTAPDAVLSDYRLRGQQTGLQAIARLRQLLGDQLPALLLTGDTSPHRLRETLASGVPLLHKPVAPEHLRQALIELLGGRHLVAGEVAQAVTV